MKGIILAGGTGSRLSPLTRVTNKHLLPVFDKPMIYYPIETLKKLRCTDIMVVTGGNHIGAIGELLGDGSEFGMNFKYAIQMTANGIAGALSLVEDFVKDEKSFYVILGDNIFLGDVPSNLDLCAIYVQKVNDAYRFGTYIPAKKKIIEKPKNVTDGLCVTGLYKYTPEVFDFIKTLKPSERGELEITDVNNWYLEKENMSITMIKDWHDAGTFSSLLKASIKVQEKNGARRST